MIFVSHNKAAPVILAYIIRYDAVIHNMTEYKDYDIMTNHDMWHVLLYNIDVHAESCQYNSC